MTLSFIVPVYNVGNFIADCLDSLVRQDISVGDYEIICIDDGSTDNSSEIIKSYQESNTNIILIRQENAGLSCARNRGLLAARGKYIWFVDSDDCIEHNVARGLIDIAESHNLDCLHFNFDRIEENEKAAGSIQNLREAPLRIGTGKRFIRNVLSRRQNSPTKGCYVWGCIMKRAILDHTLFFNENMIAQEDTLFMSFLKLRLHRVGKLDAVIYHYRNRMSSVMNSKSEERTLKYYRSLLEMAKEYGSLLTDLAKAHDSWNYKYFKRKRIHAVEGAVFCLSAVGDDDFYNKELHSLKLNKFYPYPLRLSLLKPAADFRTTMLNYSKLLLPFSWYLNLYRKLLKNRFNHKRKFLCHT